MSFYISFRFPCEIELRRIKNRQRDTEKLELYDTFHIFSKLDSFQVFVKDCVITTRVKLKKLCYRTNGAKAYALNAPGRFAKHLRI